MSEIPDAVFAAAVEPPAEELRTLRLAVSDPGAFLPRNGLPLVAWQARAAWAAGFRRTAPARRGAPAEIPPVHTARQRAAAVVSGVLGETGAPYPDVCDPDAGCELDHDTCAVVHALLAAGLLDRSEEPAR